MKRHSVHFWIGLVLALPLQTTFLFGEVPFHRGVNLSNWFQEPDAQSIQFTQYTEDDIADIQSLGVDVIRLPINLHSMTLGDADHTLDPLFLYFLDEVVSWCEIYDIHLILDNHSFDPAGNTSPSVHQFLLPIWTQLAEHYAGGYQNIYYEILNEPHGIDEGIWSAIQGTVISAIRAVDTSHTIIVGSGDWNSYNGLGGLPNYADDNLIYTFHFYDPFVFSHQGASWTDPSMVSLSGVPFPYDDSMPAVPADLIGTWVASNMASYPTHGTVAHVRSLLDIAVAFRESRDEDIFCGEFGVYDLNSPPDDRVYWYDEIVHYLDSLEIPWTMWDYHGGFGLFEAEGYGLFDHDLNIPLVEAMGFNVPLQTEFELVPDSSAIDLYTDYVGEDILWSVEGDLEMMVYDDTEPYHGSYSLKLASLSQYSSFRFEFEPIKDLSYLVDQGCVLSIMIRANGTPEAFDIRFLDTDTGESDHEWRMGTTLAADDIDWNGNWVNLAIPLSDLQELGAWEDAWYDPTGLFDWAALDRFEIVAERGAMNDAEVWIDQLRIIHPDQVYVAPQKPERFQLLQSFPNPFNPSTTIQFGLNQPSEVRLDVFNIKGEQVEALIAGNFAPGEYEHSWLPKGLESGVYILRLELLDQIQTLRVLYLR